jgi:hypothetical protein
VDRLRLILPVLLALVWAPFARAATVAIVEPGHPSRDVQAMVARIHGELLSVGFAVEMADRPSTRSPGTPDYRSWLVWLAEANRLDVVVDVVGDAVPVAVDVWIVAGAPAGLQLSRVTMDSQGDNASERLAVRSVEVLRSHFLEVDLASRKKRPDVASALVTEPPPVTADEEPERLGLAAGGAVLSSLDGVGSLLLPMVRLEWAVRPSLLLDLSLAGLGTAATVAGDSGSAEIKQELALLGGHYRYLSQASLRPFAGLAAGLLHTSVQGSANLPRQAHVGERWSFVLDASGGTEVRLPGRYYFLAAAHAQVAMPYVAIHVGDGTVASSGRPNLLVTLAVGGWL